MNRRMLQPYACYLLPLYFHIHWVDTYIVVKHAEIGVVKCMVGLFPTAQPPPPSYSFRTTPLPVLMLQIQ